MLSAHLSKSAQTTFTLLDLRLLVHLAAVVGTIAAIHVYGPPPIQAPVDRYVVTPLVAIQQELASGARLMLGRGAAPARAADSQ